MDLTHTDYQSLSACEAMDLHRRVSQDVIDAYRAGINLILATYDGPLEDLMKANKKALEAIGFYVTTEEAANFLTLRLRENIDTSHDVV